MKTFKQIIEYFESEVSNSLFLKSFYWGLPWEAAKDKDVYYPSLFVEDTMSNNVSFAAGLYEEYTVSFYVLDRGFEDKSNRLQILNETNKISKLIINNVTAFLNDDDDLEQTPEFSLLPFEDSFPDLVYGWRVTFTFKQVFTVDCIDYDEYNCA